MEQASERIDQESIAAGTRPEVAPEVLDLGMATARIESGLLMVFGPEGDPLPPQVFQNAAAVQPEARLAFETDHEVGAARVADVLEAQSRRRLDGAEDAEGGWLRAMLGIGPRPEVATAEELATEPSIELTLFGRELLIGAPGGACFVLRCRRPDDDEPALVARDADGTWLDHDALIGALSAGPGLDAHHPWPCCRFEVEAPDVIVIAGDGRRIRITESALDDGGSVLSRPSGDAASLAALVEAVGPADAGVAAEGSGGVDDDLPGNRGMTSASIIGLPLQLELDHEGLLDLGWLAAAGDELAGGRFESVLLSGMPESVRFSSGCAEGAAWRVTADEVQALTMVATPEGLEAFTLEIRFEGGDRPVDRSLPVTVPRTEHGVAECSAAEPLSIRLDFPPPFSVRNRLEYFAVVMIDGLPAGATLSDGVPGGDGRWILAPEALKGLRAHFPAGAALPCRLTVTGVTIENRDGLLSTASRSLTIDPGGFHPDGAPAVIAALDLGPLLTAAGQDQRIDAVALSGLPPVVDLSRGTFDRVSGCWVLRRDELDEIEMIVRDPALRHVTLKAKAVAIDQRGQASAISRTLEVDVPNGAAAELASLGAGPGFFRALAARRA